MTSMLQLFLGGTRMKSCHKATIKLLLVAVLLISAHPCPAFSAPGRDTAGPAVTLPASAHTSERVYNLPGLNNVGRVAPGVLRGAAVGRNGYATLKALGVKTVIDLRTTENERKQVEAAGMTA